MKAFAILSATLTVACCASTGAVTLQELNSHLFTNAAIVWQAPTNHLPKSFWIYQRRLPRIFSETIISNAIVLGSLQDKGVPKPSTNLTCIEAEPPCPCANVCNFFIDPSEAALCFQSPDYKNPSLEGIPADPDIAGRAWEFAPQLGLDVAHLVQTRFFSHVYNVDQGDHETTNFVCGRGAFLARQLDGVAFFSADEAGGGAEGFSMEFGSYGKIRYFSLRWSEVDRYQSQPTATAEQIIHCIRAHKIIVLPNYGEQDFFARLRLLASTKTLTVTKITPYYGEGMFGEMPANDEPCRFAIPFAELEATADFGSSNAVVRFVSPILSSEVSRLLSK